MLKHFLHKPIASLEGVAAIVFVAFFGFQAGMLAGLGLARQEFFGASAAGAAAPTVSVTLTANPTSGNYPLAVTLTATVTTDYGGDDIRWTFECVQGAGYDHDDYHGVGPRGVETEQVVCVYDQPGTYAPRVTINLPFSSGCQKCEVFAVVPDVVVSDWRDDNNNPPPSATGNGSICVSHTVPAAMTAQESVQASVTFRNSGITTWQPPQYYVYLSEWSGVNAAWRPLTMQLPRAIAPGENVTVNFLLSAAGSAGTFPIRFGLVQNGVETFGELCGQSVAVSPDPPHDELPPGCLVNSGSIFSTGGSFTGQGPANAFDGAASFYSGVSSMDTSIGRNYGSNPRVVKRVELYRTSSYSMYGRLQYSNDGSTWTDTDLVVYMPANTDRAFVYDVSPGYGPHQFWRIKDFWDDGYHQIDELKFYDCPIISATVDLKADGSDGPIDVATGSNVTLSWTSQNALVCQVSNSQNQQWQGQKAVTGSQVVANVTADETFGIECNSADDQSFHARDTVTVKVCAAPPCSSPPSPQVACQIYGVSDINPNTKFFTVDPRTKAFTAVGGTQKGYDIEGLAIHPDGTRIFVSSAETGVKPGGIYTVDYANNAKLAFVGSTGFPNGVRALAFNPVDKKLWGWVRNTGLITIDIGTGAGTLVKGSSMGSVEGLAWSNDGKTLYVSKGKNELYAYDPQTKLFTRIATNVPAVYKVESLDMRPDGILLVGTDAADPSQIFSYDPLAKIALPQYNLSNLNYKDVSGVGWPRHCMYPVR